MTLVTPGLAPPSAVASACVLDVDDLPALPGRELTSTELRAWVREVAARPELWERYVRHDGADERGSRHFVSLYRDADIDVWLLCWNLEDDTGWHDHDTSSGAVAVTRGAVTESRPRLGGTPVVQTVRAGRTLAFGPDHIHRMGGAVDGSVSIHAYSPPLWRMGQYSISDSGVMRRWSVSYADELRPLDG
ncbi:cysteine dioxygenase [Nocardioides litoris]|uniref:cysteine dioxygenase n=1 Tax=Nocardioides litoris TaxID=1926648 RepID=UPI00111FE30F|nr:cysteine dioxygenase family protein [Nocardioides litoris]